MAEMPENNPQGGTPAQAKQTIKLKPLAFKAPLRPISPSAPASSTVAAGSKTVRLAPPPPPAPGAQPVAHTPTLMATATRGIPKMKPVAPSPAVMPGGTATRAIPLMKPVTNAPSVQPTATATRAIPLAQIRKPVVPGIQPSEGGTNTTSRPIPTAVGTASRPIPTAVGTASRPISTATLKPAAPLKPASPLSFLKKPAAGAHVAPAPGMDTSTVAVAPATQAIPLTAPAGGAPLNLSGAEFEQTQTVKLHRPPPHSHPSASGGLKLNPNPAQGSRLSTGAAPAPGAKTVVLQPPQPVSTATVGISTQTGVIGTQTGVIGTQTGVIGTQTGVIGTQTGVIGTQTGVIGTQTGVIGTQTGVIGTETGVMDTQTTGISAGEVPTATIAMTPKPGSSTVRLNPSPAAPVLTPVTPSVTPVQEMPETQAPAATMESPAPAADAVAPVPESVPEETQAEESEDLPQSVAEVRTEPHLFFTIFSALAALVLLAFLALAAIQYCNHWEGTSIQIPGLEFLSQKK